MDAFTNADQLSQTGLPNGIPAFKDGGLSAANGAEANVWHLNKQKHPHKIWCRICKKYCTFHKLCIAKTLYLNKLHLLITKNTWRQLNCPPLLVDYWRFNVTYKNYVKHLLLKTKIRNIANIGVRSFFMPWCLSTMMFIHFSIGIKNVSLASMCTEIDFMLLHITYQSRNIHKLFALSVFLPETIFK